MANKTVRLEDLCTIRTGTAINRAKKNATNSADAKKVFVLVPAAINAGVVADKELAIEEVANVKEDLFTKEGDVVLKSSTPYDCAYIDANHEGLLVTSFGLILRRAKNSTNMQYLAAFLNHPDTNQNLRHLSQGSSLKLLSKKQVVDIPVVIPPPSKQKDFIKVYELTLKQRECASKIIDRADQLINSRMAELIRER